MDTPHLTDLFSAQSPLPSLDDDLWHREEEEEPGFAQPPPSAPEPSAEPVSPLPLLDDSWTLLDEELGFVPPLPFAPEPSAGLVSPPVAMSSPACSLSAGSSTSDFGPQKRSHSPDLNDEDEEDDDDDEAERAGEADEPSFSSKRPKGADGKQSKRTAQYRTSKRGTRGDTPMVATFVACFLVTDALRKGSRLPASLPAEAFADTAAIWNSRGGRMPSKKNAKAPPKPLKRQIEQHLQALAIHLGFAPPLSSAELNRCRLTKPFLEHLSRWRAALPARLAGAATMVACFHSLFLEREASSRFVLSHHRLSQPLSLNIRIDLPQPPTVQEATAFFFTLDNQASE
eukprot:m.293162 g.293162  ORF g.293162 m.293162 type:complete len:343 (+) comp55119_c0_seq25:217-1245(+)